jgi:hypothetical protein
MGGFLKPILGAVTGGILAGPAGAAVGLSLTADKKKAPKTTAPTLAQAEADKKAQDSATMKKVLIYSGIGVGVLIVGFIAYKAIKKG